MPTADVKEWLHHWQDEADAAFLYLALAGQESDPHKKDVYIKLAGVEERHVQMWTKLLAEHGHQVEQARPSANARLRAWFGRRFGTRYLLPMLLREEGQEVKGYLNLHRESSHADAQEVSLQLAKESAAHAGTLADLAAKGRFGRLPAQRRLRIQRRAHGELWSRCRRDRRRRAGARHHDLGRRRHDRGRALDGRVRISRGEERTGGLRA